MKNLLLYLFSFVLILSSCVEKNVKENTDSTVGTSFRNPGFNADFMDSLMVDIITYVGKKHAHSTFETRFTPEFRNHYIEMADDFEMKEIILMPDSGYYFYMLRPARSVDPEKNKRGVLGKFFLDQNNKINDFQELVNTPPGNTVTLLKSGKTLMSMLIEAGSVESLLQDKNLVEWPDGRLYYDKQRYEWRYVDAE